LLHKSSLLFPSTQVRVADGTSIVSDVRKELAALEGQIRKARGGEKKALRIEERQLRTEIRKREERVVASILRSADVVLATNTGAATKSLQRVIMRAPEGSAASGDAAQHYFDVVVIDEVAQATEASCYIPAVLGGKLVVAGDHLQLPPTVISEEAARGGLSVTLADRIASKFEKRAAVVSSSPDDSDPASHPAVVCLLDVQYRMHATIMQVGVCCWNRALRFAPHPFCSFLFCVGLNGHHRGTIMVCFTALGSCSGAAMHSTEVVLRQLQLLQRTRLPSSRQSHFPPRAWSLSAQRNYQTPVPLRLQTYQNALVRLQKLLLKLEM
jgi:hypothetical protein